jgi:predicted exporter
MNSRTYLTRRLLAVLILLAVTGLFLIGLFRLQFDADVLNILPQDDPILADGRYVFQHHPVQERIVVDISRADGNIEELERAADLIEQRMRESGLFREIGFQSMSGLFPELLRYVTGHLPVLFDRKELEKKVKPMLEPEKITATLADHLRSFTDLDGIGQADLVARDPLGLRNLVLARLADLAPVKGATIHQGRLLSRDGKHLLIVTQPLRSGMDTRFAREIARLMAGITQEAKQKFGARGGLQVTSFGAYRVALDNEENAKKNVERAMLLATAAIALLLIVCFHRPLIGLLALLPAFGGTMMAFFVYSLFHPSISLMALGFGGAIISFTVDYGLTYLLFLDRPYATRGMAATREVWNLGLLAMLTTAVSFAFLTFSGFPALVQIGQFAALGVVFTYILVHLVFPLFFPILAPAKRKPLFPLQLVVDKLASGNGVWKIWAALAFGGIMLFFARPAFHVNPASMNAISSETLQAEQQIRNTWGDIYGRVYLLLEGENPAELQRKADQLALLLKEEVAAGRIGHAFTPAAVFPGAKLAQDNLTAWRDFWRPEKRAALEKTLDETSLALGFAPEAFAAFRQQLAAADGAGVTLPESFLKLLGGTTGGNGAKWYLVTTLIPGPAYNGETFFRTVAESGVGRLFDPNLFGERLGSVLMSAFLRMAVIVGIVTLLVAFLILLDWQLTLIAFLPTVFAMVCTLGTLNLLGEPLGIPMVMVAVVVIGMGTDYALYLVRSHQRYYDEDHPSLGLVRQSVSLSFATTFLGVGVLALSDNALLKNAGLGLTLGIGYSFLGAFMITPPLLKWIFRPVVLPSEQVTAGSKLHQMRVIQRYRHIEGYPRLFARFKMLTDPMFRRLAGFIEEPKVVMDIGTGYGVPATWILELYPKARLYGIDPVPKRVAVAARAIGNRGEVSVGAAPDIPVFTGEADTALMLDMIHFISDDALRLTLTRIREKLAANGLLVMRATVPRPTGDDCAGVRGKRWGRGSVREYYRTEQEIREILGTSGFSVLRTEPSAPGKPEIWLQARRTA